MADKFWRLVEDSLRHSPGRGAREEFLRDRLAFLAPTDIVQFQVCLAKACQRAYTWDLWGAAVRIFGGWCSDDGFAYFRLWLVGRGRDGFESAVGRSDALAGFPEIGCLAGRHCRTWNSDEEWPEWESLNYLAAEAYGRAIGDDDECAQGFYAAVKAQLGGEVFPRYPAGERWDAHDETAAALKVPALARMFGLDTLR